MKLSDKYIEEHYLDSSPIHNSTIVLEEYSEEWPERFLKEKQKIKQILSDNALMIEHIGSTSVAHLCAKPIIDILLVVEDAKNEKLYLNQLCNNGYILRIKEPEFENHHMFINKDMNVHLHVFSKGSIEIEKYILFRNYLRKHDDARIMYEDEKRKLASKKWKYVQNYADAKSKVIEIILNRAIEERKSL